MRCGGLLAAALLASGWACPQTSQRDSTESRIEGLWQQAAAAQQAQEYSRAAGLYKKILLLRPNLNEAEVNLGLMYQLTGDLHAAIACFQHVLKNSPELFSPNLLTGLDYLKLDNAEAALPYLQRAVAAKPQDAKARMGLANSCLQLRRYPEAEQYFRQAIGLDGKNADARYGLGATYLSMEKEAEVDIRKSASPFGRILLGESYSQQGRSAKGIKILRSVVDSTPAVPCTHSLLGFAYLRDAQLDNASVQFQIDWDTPSAQGCLLAKLGLVALAADRGNGDGALERLREAVDIDSISVQNNTEFFWNALVKAGVESKATTILGQHGAEGSHGLLPELAPSYWAKGQYSACSAALAATPAELTEEQLRLLSRCSYYAGSDDLVLHATSRLVKAFPGDPEALYWRIQSLERSGLAALAQAIEVKPDAASLHVLMGDMLRGKGDFAQAGNEYRKAIALKPDFLPAHKGLARELYSDNDLDAAAQELQYVLKANPNDPEASYLMGEILVSRQEYAGALPLLLQGLHAAPDQLPHVHAGLSKVYAERGDLSRAIAEIQQALPGDVDGSYYYRLGRLYLRAGDRAASAQAMQQSAKLRHQSDSSASLEEEQ